MNSSAYYINAVDLKEKVDIIQVIGEVVDLAPKGKDFWGICPFHNEKTASFSVSDKQFFYCFGCHQAGDVFDFVKSYYHMDFKSAYIWLAQRYGNQDTSISVKDVKAKRIQQQKQKIRKEIAELIIREEYNRLCKLERACYRIMDTIQHISDLDRPEVIAALTTKDRLGFYIDEMLMGNQQDKLYVALMVRGVEL